MTSTEMIKLLLKNSFKQIPGGKGPHKKFFQESTGKFTVVPDHKQELGKGFWRNIQGMKSWKKRLEIFAKKMNITVIYQAL